MVAQRRVGPLLFALFVALAIVLARAFQVQVLQHGIWAGEAASMLQVSEIVPYYRGSILDSKGLVLARDEDHDELRLIYRDFRRGSPIAQVAHARSSLEMRAVPLPEAEQHLEQWAAELIALRPCDLAAFARGAALGGGAAPELDPTQARSALRERRANDLRYYAAELLELPPGERGCLAPHEDAPEAQRTLLELAAGKRGRSAGALQQELAAGLREARTRLAHLAELVERDSKPPALEGPTPLARLLGLLEGERRRIEDDTADALFRDAAGFDPGRVSTRLLEQRFDTAWIARALRWDDARRHEWIASRREDWQHKLAEVLLPRALAQAQSEPIRARRADRLMSELALFWAPGDEELRAADGQPRSWREFDEPCVLCELDSLFDRHSGAHAVEPARKVLPFQDESLQQLARVEQDRWRVLGALADLARGAEFTPPVRALPAGWRPPAGPLEAAQRWSKIGAEHRRLDTEDALLELSWLFFALEQRFQGELERQLDLAYERCGASAPLPFHEDRLSRAAEDERFLALDRSTRPVVVCRQPSWELVQLVARGAGSFDGFYVEHGTVRVRPEGAPLAAGLVGRVRRPTIQDLLAQNRQRARLAQLRSQLVRDSEEEGELRELSAELFRADEWTGGSGIEGFLDEHLRGRNGFQEIFSMGSEAQAAQQKLKRAPVDGEDVELTLDAELQRAAQEVCDHPVMPGGDESDQLWCKNPVGAIVLITPQGDILAAASAPSADHLARTPGRDEEHSHLRERTLTRPTINPPGSTFKAFEAAYAIDRLHFDREQEFSCEKLKDGGFGFETIHCHGHGKIRLNDALVESCNAYFGQLAAKVYKPQDFLDMAHLFGFGEPTGISPLDGRGHYGLHEDWKIPDESGVLEQLTDKPTLMRFACGLSPMEATPMQVARATAGLATGTLPELRLVSKIGAEEQPQRSRPLGLSREALDFVRHALAEVVTRGTAHVEPLQEHSLGFSFACKTGSADVYKFKESPDLTDADRADMKAGKWRKHTWIAGWFPAEHPRAILVVYLHDTSETATRTAVWFAAQFLHQEAVRRLALSEESAR